MKLEVGKKYHLNNGEEYVCTKTSAGGFKIGHFWYQDNGVFVGRYADHRRSIACEVTDDQYKPLKDFTPFKAGERFQDDQGDVLTICDDCRTFAWTEINGEYYPPSLASYEIDDRSNLVTSLDRDDDTPKLWRDMTDAENRVRSEPSFLPLKAGKTYQIAEEGNWECIHVENGNAWLKRFDSTPAYVWEADTGFAKYLPKKYDITGLDSGET